MATSFSGGGSRSTRREPPTLHFAQWVRSLDPTTHTSLSPIRRGFAPGFVNYKNGALDSQLQVIQFTSCLPMVGGSLRVLLGLALKIYCKILDYLPREYIRLSGWLIFDFWCFDATFSNISAISWRPALVVEEAYQITEIQPIYLNIQSTPDNQGPGGSMR
jgi:hypothetical protein